MIDTNSTEMHKKTGLTEHLDDFLHIFDHRASRIEERLDKLARHRSQTGRQLDRVTDLFAIGIAVLLCLLPLVIALR
jgi:hypothetical protein